MRKLIGAGLIVALCACANMPAGQDRRAEAYALAKQRADLLIGNSFKSLSGPNRFDVDCSEEVGANARQCKAFEDRMAVELGKLEAAERPKALAEVEDELAALAAVIATLSDTDIAALRANAELPPSSKHRASISEEGAGKIQEADMALNAALMAFDQRIGDQFNDLTMRILFLLMADPALRQP